MKLPTLYTKTARGQIQVWEIEIEGCQYRTHEGLINGTVTTSKWTVSKAKNEGRANATTAEEQAVKDATSKWEKKAKTGYSEDINKAGQKSYFDPMLAHKYSEYPHKIKWPCFIQLKANGCLHYDTLISMSDGTQKKIGDLVHSRSRELVKTYNTDLNIIENKPITATMLSRVNEGKPSQWYKLEFEDGRTLTITGNHRIWVNNLKCWRRVEDLDGTEDILPLAIN